MNKNVIVTYCNRECSMFAERLKQTCSAHVGDNVDILIYDNHEDIEAPDPISRPYSFKPYIFNRLKNLGYHNVLYAGANLYAINNLYPLFEIIEMEGYLMEDTGHNLQEYCNDRTLLYFGLNRIGAKKIPLYGNGDILGLNLLHPMANDFLEQWSFAEKRGAFNGKRSNIDFTESLDPRCLGHANDKAVGSIIAYQLGMELKKLDSISNPVNFAGLEGETTYFKIDKTK